MAKQPPRPSVTAPQPAAPKPAAFKPCHGCKNPGDCGFEEACADVRKGAGRPSLYSPEKAQELIDWVASGNSQRRWCDLPGNPNWSTVWRWQRAHPDFATSLAQAREEWTHALIDDAQAIADDGHNDTYKDAEGNERVDTDVVQRSKLRVDARLRLAAMVNPRRYGQKIDLTVNDERMSDEALNARIAELGAALGIVGPEKAALPAPE